MLAIGFLSVIAGPANAKDQDWQVATHPDYHVAMIKQVDDVIVAIYASKEPSQFGSPLLMETVLAPCGEKKPLSLHSTQAIFLFGATVQARSKEIGEALESFLEGGQSTCNLAEDIEPRFFVRFEAAYAAADAILVEAGILPLTELSPDSEDTSDDNGDRETE
jgi:hypothetical protein